MGRPYPVFFPSQKPEDVVRKEGGKPAKSAEDLAKEKEARQDTFYLFIAVFGFLAFMTLLMVPVLQL